MSSDNAKRREAVRIPRLEWQNELDSAMAVIDSRLTNPRRRATDSDTDPQPRPPDPGHGTLTPDLLDEIAWRVAEEIRRNPPVSVVAAAAAPAAPSPEHDHEHAGLRPGKMLLIRYTMPRLPWPFRLLQRRRRKKQHPLTTARVRG